MPCLLRLYGSTSADVYTSLSCAFYLLPAIFGHKLSATAQYKDDSYTCEVITLQAEPFCQPQCQTIAILLLNATHE